MMKCSGSITVEITIIMTFLLGVFIFIFFSGFYIHDKCLITKACSSASLRSSEAIDIDEAYRKERIAIEALEQTFKPELLNRLDNIVVFNKLNRESCYDIVNLMLNMLKDRQAKRDIKLIERFLLDIGLMMHPKKTQIQEVRKGVEFLGSMIFPFNITPGKRVRKNMHKALYEVAEGSKSVATVVSYIGHSAHLKSYKVCGSAFDKVGLPYFAGEWGGGIMNFEQSLKRLKYRA